MHILGWALARIPWSLESYLKQLESKNSQFPDPLIGWLALDGYGFHQGYFYWRKYIEEIAIPKGLSGYSLRVFDQGLGRSLWFVCGADVKRITEVIKNFPSNRQADLWSGIGLASTYAGGVGEETIQALVTSAESYLPQLAQGSAFAAKARQRAGNLNSHTEMTCQIIWGISAEEAAEITDRSLEDLPNNGQLATYEIWRQRIQNQFVAMEVN